MHLTVHDETYVELSRRMLELARLNEQLHVEPDGGAENRLLVVEAIEVAEATSQLALECFRLYKDEAALRVAVENDELVEELVSILANTDKARGLVSSDMN